MPKGRAATCGTTRAPASTPRSDSSIKPRHASGAASICSSVNETGRSSSSDSRRIQAISCWGASRSSPEAPSGASSKTPPPARRMARPSANSSSSAANVPGTGRPSIARCPSVRDVEKPSAPASTASCTTAAIAAISSGVAGSFAAPRSPIAYARTAPCDTCTPTSIPNSRAVERVEVLGERLPAPVDALGERGAGDVLDAFHEADQPLLVTRANGGEPDAAVAGDHGGDPVPGRRLEQRVPRGLAVVVGVDVDEAGRDQQPGRVDGLGGVAGERRPRHRDDRAVLHRHVTDEARVARAVDDGAAGDLDVVHVRTFSLWPQPQPQPSTSSTSARLTPFTNELGR